MGDSPQCAIASESWSNILSLASSEAIAAGMLVHGSTPSSGQKLPARPQKIRKMIHLRSKPWFLVWGGTLICTAVQPSVSQRSLRLWRQVEQFPFVLAVEKSV